MSGVDLPFEKISQNTDRVVLDTNALIDHSHDPSLYQALRSELDLERKRALLLEHKAAFEQFYDGWLALIDRFENIYVTNAVFDLELSGWRFLGDNPQRYRFQFPGQRIPRGHLVQDYDSRKIRARKNKLLEALNKRRLNPILKSKAKALRKALKSSLSSRPIWQTAFQDEGLSMVDQDLIINLICAASLGSCALVSNDRALRTLLTSLQRSFRQPQWAKGTAMEAHADALKLLNIRLVEWRRDESFLSFRLL